MWGDAEQTRLDALREKEENGALDPGEELELSALYAALDAEESERLGPAGRRAEQEICALRERNARLTALIGRRRELSNRMRAQLAKWLEEYEQLEAEGASLAAPRRAA